MKWYVLNKKEMFKNTQNTFKYVVDLSGLFLLYLSNHRGFLEDIILISKLI